MPLSRYTYTLGHAAFHAVPLPTTIPPLHAITRDRPVRGTLAGTTIRSIACTEEEYRAVCIYLARRRAKTTRRTRKGLHRAKAK